MVSNLGLDIEVYPVSQWASEIDPMFRIRSIPTDGLRSLSFATLNDAYIIDGFGGYPCLRQRLDGPFVTVNTKPISKQVYSKLD